MLHDICVLYFFLKFILFKLQLVFIRPCIIFERRLSGVHAFFYHRPWFFLYPFWCQKEYRRCNFKFPYYHSFILSNNFFRDSVVTITFWSRLHWLYIPPAQSFVNLVFQMFGISCTNQDHLLSILTQIMALHISMNKGKSIWWTSTVTSMVVCIHLPGL